nr:chemotaxis protein CheD [Fusibacter paucivorans]
MLDSGSSESRFLAVYCFGDIGCQNSLFPDSPMAHIMLPSSKAIRKNENVAKFADTAVVELIKQMESKGAKKVRFFAKIAGGAQMFSFSSQNDAMKIGERNAEAVRGMLKELNIPIKADDTGGNFGRTIEFYSDDGRLLIKTAGKGVKEL